MPSREICHRQVGKWIIIQAVFPDAAFERLPSSVLQRARCPGRVGVAALQRILETPSLIQEFGLEKSREACVCTISQERSLVGFVQILPVAARLKVLLLIGRIVQACRNLRDAVVVVTVLERAGNTPGHCAETLVVEILHRNILCD